MKTPPRTAALLAPLLLAACGAGTGAPAAPVQPAGAGEAGRSAAAPAPADTGRADVRFMQGMLHHHAQALEMTALVPARSARADVRLLAERIDVSQRDEIATMQRWLREHGAEVPAVEGGHAHHGAGARMPGMATPEEMARLAAASGDEFDRLFLELMIRHHEGALVMVGELFAAEGAAREPELFQIASDVDADQRAEIARMRRLLAAAPSGARPR